MEEKSMTIKLNQFIIKYLMLCSVTALIYPLFIFFSYYIISIDVTKYFIPFVVLNFFIILIPQMIKNRISGFLEKILNIIFIIIIPQAFSLFVFKPLGVAEMVLSQLLALGIYIFSYLKLESEEYDINFNLIFSGLIFMVFFSILSWLVKVPKNIYEQYTIFSLLFIIITIFVSNKIHLDTIANKKYRRLNSVSNNITYINIIIDIAFLVAVLLLFKFRYLAPYIANFIYQVFIFTLNIIKKIILFISSLFAHNNSDKHLEAAKNTLIIDKSYKKSLLALILDILGYIIGILVMSFLLYKFITSLKGILLSLYERILQYLSSFSNNITIYDHGQNYTDTKSFIFLSPKKRRKRNKRKINDIRDINKLKDNNTKLRFIFKRIIEFYWVNGNHNFKLSNTPNEMINQIIKGELIYDKILKDLGNDYSLVRYKNNNIDNIDKYIELYKNLK
ncbi:hypothetical protein ACAG39_04945 [Caldicellulosiruptoraceae bacterium PP1]